MWNTASITKILLLPLHITAPVISKYKKGSRRICVSTTGKVLYLCVMVSLFMTTRPTFQKRMFVGNYTNAKPEKSNGNMIELKDARPIEKKYVSKKGQHHIRPQNSNTNHNSKYAWLMSFPNSGTSFTLKVVRRLSSTTTATNYRKKSPLTVEEEKEYMRIIRNKKDIALRPFLSDDNALPLPDSGYMLTKTHCGCRCSMCPPEKYLETMEVFLNKCLKLEFEVRDIYEQRNIRYNPMYDKSLIERAVHLLRNPFDNIISRFHLYRQEQTKEWQETHPKNADGFQLYCDEMNQIWLEEERNIDQSGVDMERVPCHSEFRRYIAWHDNVVKVLDHLSIPSHNVFYEDYRDDFENTTFELLQFLELPMLRSPAPFSSSNYSEYFSKEQREAARIMMQHQASPDVWNIIASRYGFT